MGKMLIPKPFIVVNILDSSRVLLHITTLCLPWGMGYPASSGFSRPNTMLRRERNYCEHRSASLIEPLSSAKDE